VRVVVEDVSHFLLRGREPYDLIISDGKQNPDFSSNWTLMCRELYEHALSRLGEAGLFVQWIPLSTIAVDFRTTLRTFTEVFPHAEAFMHAPYWVMLVGSASVISGRPRFQVETYRSLAAVADLQRLRFENRDALLSERVAGGEALREVTGPGPISTWDRSPLEFSAYKTPLDEKLRATQENLTLLLEANEQAVAAGDSPFGRPMAPWTRSTRLLWRAHLHELEGEHEVARARVERALVVNPADRRAQHLRALFAAPPTPAMGKGGSTPVDRPPEPEPPHPPTDGP
jgi:hypothetical protein